MPDLDAKLIQQDLDNLGTAIPRLLERDPPAHVDAVDGAATALAATVRVAQWTCRAVFRLCADTPRDPTRKHELSLAVPPLARTVTDQLFTVVFLCEDLPARVPRFWKAGWREMAEEDARLHEAYGSDPAWTDFLRNHRAHLHSNPGGAFHVTAAEQADPRSIPYWPIPGRMLKSDQLTQADHAYLSYVNDWFYRHLSSASHGSAVGTLRRATLLDEPRDYPERETYLAKFRSDSVMTIVTIFLALLSEVEIGCRLGRDQAAKYLWRILVDHGWGQAEELYARRYESLL